MMAYHARILSSSFRKCPIAFLYIFLIAYLAGSIPSSLWLGKIFYGLDIRQRGSGNAGASNTYRILGWKAGLLVLCFDIAKGALPTFYATQLFPASDAPVFLQILAATAAVLGHCFTCFARFRGGKGVATALGAFMILFPIGVPICLIVFAVTLALTRYISLASMMAVAFLPIVEAVLILALDHPVHPALFVLSLLLVPFILFMHRSNISRLLAGTETPVKPQKKKL